MGGLGTVAPWACAIAISCLAVQARAGDTTGGSSTTSSDTETTTDGGTTNADTSGDEFCGDDCSAPGEVTIESPVDGAVVPSTFTVTLAATADCYCDTCGCFPEDVESIGLSLDGENVGSCASSPCIIEVQAEVGEHSLRASATWFFSEQEQTIAIRVEGDGATDGENESATQTSAEDATIGQGGTESNDSTASAGTDDDTKSSGCGCTSGGSARPLAWLVLVGALARRRRTRCRIGALAVMTFASTAHAGGTTTTTDTGTDSSGTDTTGSTSTGSSTSEGGSFDEGSCGECSAGADGAIVFTSPQSHLVQSPFEVEVEASADCSCDDCGCYNDPPSQIAFQVDGEPRGAPCDASPCSAQLHLSAGPHVITAIASYSFHENMAMLEVEVEESEDPDAGFSASASASSDGDGDDDPDGTGSGESSSAAARDDADDGGCSCRAEEGGTAGPRIAVALFGLFFAALRRRR
jgi:MYXO-CTERM domain-containing protein